MLLGHGDGMGNVFTAQAGRRHAVRAQGSARNTCLPLLRDCGAWDLGFGGKWRNADGEQSDQARRTVGGDAERNFAADRERRDSDHGAGMTLDPQRQRPWIVIVGGFLGSGKTSLILAAAHLLEQRGLRCAVILNDQGDELVDTRHADEQGMLARKVTGGCFCCRFSGLMEVIEELRSRSLDVIFAEPVGSCTDISATVFGPLREEFDKYRVAPFTVLADRARAADLLGEDADSDLAFLFHKQLQEADLVCMSKSDLYPDAVGIAGVEARWVSAKTGQGVEAWLDEILFGSLDAGRTTPEIDYARYARAEAALAWLNLSFTFEPARTGEGPGKN